MLDALLTFAVIGASFAYAVGIRRLWSASRTVRLVSSAQAAAFAAGIATLLLALTSPLEDAATRNLPWHMVQHLLLLTVAAPLLAVGEPVTVMSRALPRRGQRSVSRVVRRVTRSQTSFHGWLVWTAVAFALSTAALAVWHVPALYDAAVRDTGLHVLEHGTFVVTATLFWWMALGASRRSRRGLGVLSVFVATLPASALGILMTLARTPWYAPYGSGAAALRSQQIAGAVMWGFGGSALVVAAAALFASWLTSMERLDHHGRPPQPVEPW